MFQSFHRWRISSSLIFKMKGIQSLILYTSYMYHHLNHHLSLTTEEDNRRCRNHMGERVISFHFHWELFRWKLFSQCENTRFLMKLFLVLHCIFAIRFTVSGLNLIILAWLCATAPFLLQYAGQNAKSMINKGSIGFTEHNIVFYFSKKIEHVTGYFRNY